MKSRASSKNCLEDSDFSSVKTLNHIVFSHFIIYNIYILKAEKDLEIEMRYKIVIKL